MAEETAAAQHARRHYRQDHFQAQVYAERAYFRVLAESLTRGREIAVLARKLGKARSRANALAAINADLRKQLLALSASRPPATETQTQETEKDLARGGKWGCP